MALPSSITSETTPSTSKKYVKEYDRNGNLKAEGWMLGENKDAYWKFYYPNNKLKKRGHFKDNTPIKYWYFYREDGIIESEGHYVNGFKNEWWLFYDKMGNVFHKCQLKNNKKNGYCFRYKNKKLIKAEKYKEGKKMKEWTDFKSFKKENNLSDLE